ncbi:bifunctional glutamate N-acetyltransferase/amino-acid acetyltransferase ArgJ [Pontivivens insulae]|uniref:Arginine biosynthesis bifunctional protein ArgJ n=1 Tax=Pontivivens insulae TaxID=1639689 RepID=A0A2R8A6Z8_9RHOB|nr:bifunctional glutamate N-acetyltransferase/amino-acid acetyltransferase ArgJ [Pontivivens insulae]RED18117.1 glutamate N-acetyltransferase [Pontivivens insulae]SPF28014.1 Arginine biosynthesis bifunctional protein ArgJ [Pontivivens insulae]
MTQITRLMPATPKDNAAPLAPRDGETVFPTIEGVRFAAVEAGVRYQGRLDVMLAELAPGSSVAGVFTRSSTRSAPVRMCEAHLATAAQTEAPFAILVNSGNSNAFTGRAGDESTDALAKAVAARMDCPVSHVFPASTGVIGERLPHDRIVAKIDQLADSLSAEAGARAAQAIMTTDTYVKGAWCEVEGMRIAGMAKGSGMIAPDMATMLVYIFTDAAVAQPVLQEILGELTDTTFNAITVDGDTSTSDTLILGATGRGGTPRIETRDDPRCALFEEALRAVMLDLSHQVVRDGEGATKFVEIAVTGAASNSSAHKVGMSIANSPLVKTAVAGEDPNWGRIVMAVGKSGEPADRDTLSIRFGNVLVAENGWVAESYREEAGAAIMREEDIAIRVDLGLGGGAATVWTCDLTHGYISINADYRS